MCLERKQLFRGLGVQKKSSGHFWARLPIFRSKICRSHFSCKLSILQKNFCAQKVSVVREEQFLYFMFLARTPMLGSRGPKMARAVLAEANFAPKGAPRHPKYRFFGKIPNWNPHYFLILHGVTIKHFAEKSTILVQNRDFSVKICVVRGPKCNLGGPNLDRNTNFRGKLPMVMCFSSLKLTTFALTLFW